MQVWSWPGSFAGPALELTIEEAVRASETNRDLIPCRRERSREERKAMFVSWDRGRRRPPLDLFGREGELGDGICEHEQADGNARGPRNNSQGNFPGPAKTIVVAAKRFKFPGAGKKAGKGR
jgi:hypothetical protein